MGFHNVVAALVLTWCDIRNRLHNFASEGLLGLSRIPRAHAIAPAPPRHHFGRAAHELPGLLSDNPNIRNADDCVPPRRKPCPVRGVLPLVAHTFRLRAF